jgi:hypothetical protein
VCRVERVAEAGVRIDNERDSTASRIAAVLGRDFGKLEAEIGHAEPCVRTPAPAIGGLEAEVFDDAGGERICSAGSRTPRRASTRARSRDPEMS